MNIPNRLIFIWFGSEFPFANQVAVRSAVKACQPDETILIQQGLTPQTKGVKELIEDCDLKLMPADDSWFKDLPPGGDLAADLFKSLKSPASRANLLRMASLYKLGGIYLDTDTITVQNFDSLRHLNGFCGTEPVTLPSTLFQSKNPLRWLKAGVLLGVREACVHLPRGWNLFRKYFEGFCLNAVNNAVIGSAPKNPYWHKAFQYILDLPEEERLKRFRLGTHLMQNVTGNQSSEGMEVLKPEYFYPLGPEISAFWFKENTENDLQEMLQNKTLVVHWYNSVEQRLKTPISAEFISQSPTTAFAKLCRDFS